MRGFKLIGITFLCIFLGIFLGYNVSRKEGILSKEASPLVEQLLPETKYLSPKEEEERDSLMQRAKILSKRRDDAFEKKEFQEVDKLTAELTPIFLRLTELNQKAPPR